MNMHALPYIPKPRELPMPLTDVDQSTFAWHKRNHVEFMLHPKVANLSLIEEGALNRLMNHAARQAPYGSLPNDPDLLASMVRVSVARWLKMADQVLGAAFVLCADDRLYCPLMVDELSPEQAKPEQTKQRSKSAERVARMRDRKRNADVTPDVTPVTQASVTCNADVTPVTVTSVTNGGIKGGDLDLEKDLDSDKKQNLKSTCAASQHDKDSIANKFDQFWSVYPRKTDRKKAFAAFSRIKPSDELLQTILAAIATWSTKWAAEPQYIPHPTTWLNGERWNDEPPVLTKVAGTNYSNDVNQRWDQSQQLVPASPDAQAEHLRTTREMGLL